ncbi:MAG: hypothetical protein ACKVU4_11585 [Phycisphaerales bacterium]
MTIGRASERSPGPALSRVVYRRAVILAATAALGAALGCGASGPRAAGGDRAAQGREVFGGAPANAAAGGAPRAGGGVSDESWTILIEAFRGDDAEARARQLLDDVRSRGGLGEAYFERRGETTIVGVGRFSGPDDRRARAELERVKGITIGGARPFASARLMPPVVSGGTPEHDLRNARKFNGDWGAYTLQVGVYSREDGGVATAKEVAEFRRYAEDAAAKLRAEGELAFYFHGPSRSMVTIGVFARDEFDATASPPSESPAIGALKKRFPHNLQNGRGIRRRLTLTAESGERTQIERIDPSALVMIPDSE